MFQKPKAKDNASKSSKNRDLTPSIITHDVHLLGNLVSEGVVDFAGMIDGNIRCNVLTVRENGTVKGEIVADVVYIHGNVKGLIKAKSVNLLASCRVEGIIIHEQLSIEDGAFVDGKFKRSDRVNSTDEVQDEMPKPRDAQEVIEGELKPATASTNIKVLENIRLIR